MGNVSVVIRVVIFAVGAIVLTVGVLLGARLLRGQLASPTRAWMPRSGHDRRQRHAKTLAERRRGPRRQDDIARQFLSGIGKSTVVRRAGPPSSR